MFVLLVLSFRLFLLSNKTGASCAKNDPVMSTLELDSGYVKMAMENDHL